jgi:acetyltransferase-like isoleucine patch superfamily enzyme
MKPFNIITRGMERISSSIRTRAAREVAVLARSAKLTPTGKIDNICGRRDAVTIGQYSVIAGHLQVFAHGGSIRIGDWVFVGSGSHVWSAAEVVIGHRVLISHHVSIVDTSSHPIDAVARFAQTQAILTDGHPRTDPGLDSAPVRIGDDAWISYGASILRGVTIGEGAIIGAAAVVTRDVPPWSVVVGNPARVIRQLTPSMPQGLTQKMATHSRSVADEFLGLQPDDRLGRADTADKRA